MASGRMAIVGEAALILSKISKREFENERRILVEVTVANPFGLY